MKLGLLGDVHGNDRALAAVLGAASEANVDRLLVTGDLVSYYFSPRQVLNLLDDWDYSIVGGNHEVMLARSHSSSDYLAEVSERYGSGLRVALGSLTQATRPFSCSLPHPLELDFDGFSNFAVSWVALGSQSLYLPGFGQAVIEFAESVEYDLIVMGHTHYPMLFDNSECIFVNPGSVGQPRDRILVLVGRYLTPRVAVLNYAGEEYDPSELVRECLLKHIPNLFYQRF